MSSHMVHKYYDMKGAWQFKYLLVCKNALSRGTSKSKVGGSDLADIQMRRITFITGKDKKA